MKYFNKVKALQNQLKVKQKENLELKKQNEILLKELNAAQKKYTKNLLLFLLEAVIVVLLVGIGGSAMENGLASIFYPCDGNLCAQTAVAGAVRFVIGASLILIATGIILALHVSKDAPEDL
jgi:hypothetical protein